MKTIFIFAEADSLHASLLELKNADTVSEQLAQAVYRPPVKHAIPYVSEYMVDFEETVHGLRRFVAANLYKGFSRLDYRVVLPDDFTDIESHAMDEIILRCGARQGRTRT